MRFTVIGKLKGKVDSIYDNYFLLDVNGVCYLIFASGKTLSNLVKNSALEVLIDTHVREDHIHLYGFLSLEEKSAFNMLQSVKGVGTRMALAILSQMVPAEIQAALAREDVGLFNNVSGVGKKLAARIITELKDKIISTEFESSGIGVGGGVAINGAALNNNVNDAVLALVGLGIAKADAYSRVQGILGQNPEVELDELVRLALKN